MKFSVICLLLLVSAIAHAQRPAQPCAVAAYYGTPCLTNLTANINSVGSTLVSPKPSATMPSQGDSVASVNAQFAPVILWEFETESAATLNAQMAQFTNLNLSRFSHQYWVSSQGNLGLLMELAAEKLTAANLARWAAAFGPEMTQWAVTNYSPVSVQSEYTAIAKPAIIAESHAAHVQIGALALTMNGLTSGALPNINMTLYEIYTEYLWEGAETSLEAFAKTAIFAKTNLGSAFIMGYTIGSQFYAFASYIDPDYGYDLVMEYSTTMAEDFGPIDGATSGTGFVDVDDPDFYNIGYWDFSDVCVFMETC